MRISVVVPACNEEDYLAEALESLQRQHYPHPYELIVVDNNSTDATAAIARSFGVRVLHEPQPGVCAARQRGTAAARGDIVISTDADTVHPRDWLARIDAEFRRSGDVALVAGPCRYLNPSWWASLYPKLLFGAVGRVHHHTGRLVYITATNSAFLRTAFPGYDPDLTQGGDELDVLRRMRSRGRAVWLSDNTVDTSPRRLQQGVGHAICVSLVGHYLLTYLGEQWTRRLPRQQTPERASHPAGRQQRLLGRLVVEAAAAVTWAAALVATTRR